MNTANERRLAAVAMLEKTVEDFDHATQLIRHDLDLGSVELFNDPPFETTVQNLETALCILLLRARTPEEHGRAIQMFRDHLANHYPDGAPTRAANEVTQ